MTSPMALVAFPSPKHLLGRAYTSNVPGVGLSLTLTSDVAIEAVLSLIPFFSVGITAFASFSVSFVFRRIAFVSLYLYAAVLMAFIGALLDLSQILTRGAQNTQLGLGLDSVRPFIDAREIFFSLSFGFRYIYFWAAVAEGYGRPGDTNTAYFASWARWGIIGLGLKYLTLGGCFAIPVLQVIWRLGPNNSTTITAVYVAESTIQVTISALFILKILLNLFLSPSARRAYAMQYYSFPIIGLLLSLAVGIGNLVATAFSETTLGRFLQAMEMYIMLLFVLTMAFRKDRPRSSFQALPNSEKSRLPDSFFSPPPRLPTPEYATDEKNRIASRRPSMARISSWLFPRPAPRPGSTVQRPTQRQDVEKGLRDVQEESSQRTTDVVEVPRSAAPPVATARDSEPQSRRFTLQSDRSPSPAPSLPDRRPSPTVNPPNEDRAASSPMPSQPSKSGKPDADKVETAEQRPSTDVSFPSYYGQPPSPIPSVPGAQDATTTALGIAKAIRRSPSPQRESQLITPARSSGSSFEQLLREQQALDNSIRLLRLFSPQGTVASGSEAALPEGGSLPRLPKDSKEGTTSEDGMTQVSSSNSNAKFDSVSGKSEFSLSVFPEPPEEGNDFVIAKARRSVIGPRSSRSVPGKASLPFNAGSARLDSAVTQYDVTSFIAGSTTQQSQNEQAVAADRDSFGDDQASTPTGPQAPRPLLLTNVTPAPAPSIPYVPTPGVDPYVKPLILGRGRATAAGGRAISISRPRAPTVEEEPDDYEQPRPAPVLAEKGSSSPRT